MSVTPETTSLGEAAIKLGIASVLTASVVGLGSLLYYVFELSSGPSALNNLKTGTWPDQVKRRIQHLYAYLFFSIYNCMFFAFVVFSTDVLFNIFTSRAIVIVDFLIQLIVKNGESFTRLSSTGVFSLQRIAWFFYITFVGGTTSPTFLHGLTVVKISVHLTCIIVSLLVIMAMTAPVKKFYDWKQNLSIFQTAVLISSLGAIVLPVTTAGGAIFFSISFYGGLIYFASAFLCHAQEAQVSASEEDASYCALAKSVPMFLDTVNIFTRVVVLVPPN